jgi:SP family facilitated glucose transporter-like MFS transporter 1
MMCLVYGRDHTDSGTLSIAIRGLAIASVVLFVMFFAVGPGPIPWFLVSELFDQRESPAAASIAVGVNWLANFVVSLLFHPLSEHLGPYVFLVFIVSIIFFVAYIKIFVPETKDKSVAEIMAFFQ